MWNRNADKQQLSADITHALLIAPMWNRNSSAASTYLAEPSFNRTNVE